MNEGIAVAGSITRDRVVYESGPALEGPGGILYQAAALCGLGRRVHLHANCGADLRAEVERLAAEWPGLRTGGLAFVPQPANRVNLFYPPAGAGERSEVLDMAVPPLDPGVLAAGTRGRRALLFVLNSGLEVTAAGWRSFLEAAPCPVWLDVHSLVLEPVLGRPRRYRAVPDWPDWVKGVRWVQANRREIACLAGRPDRPASPAGIRLFARRAFDLGVEVLFVTLGREGATVLTPGRAETVAAPLPDGPVVDLTGCGDVFGAVALSRLLEGAPPREAAAFASALASQAAAVSGPGAVFALAAGRGRLP